MKYILFQGIDLGSGEPEWIVTKERSKWDAIFESLGPVKGKISGSTAKKEIRFSRNIGMIPIDCNPIVISL